MITIPLELPNDLARRVMPFQDRLAEIIELGFLQIEIERETRSRYPETKQRVLDPWLRPASSLSHAWRTPQSSRSSHADQGWRDRLPVR